MSAALAPHPERRLFELVRDRVCAHCGEPLPEPEPEEVLWFADLRLDVPRRALLVDGKQAAWPNGRICAIDMLAELMRWPGRVWRRGPLMTAIGMWDVEPQTVTVYAYLIRRAIRPSRSAVLRTYYGRGGQVRKDGDTGYALELIQ